MTARCSQDKAGIGSTVCMCVTRLCPLRNARARLSSHFLRREQRELSSIVDIARFCFKCYHPDLQPWHTGSSKD